MDTPRAPEKIIFERDYPGAASQAARVRADLAEIAAEFPAADDLILLASELAANATTHSRSAQPGGTFTVRAYLYPGEYAWVEVIDQGGEWTEPDPDDEHGRGLALVATIAGPGNWGIDGSPACRTAWYRLNWHQDTRHEPPATATERDQATEDAATTHDPRLYVQITRHVRRKITEGTLTAGDAVSITCTAQEWGASRQTVSKALRTLERDGLLKRYPGVGFYVLPREQPARRTRDHR